MGWLLSRAFHNTRKSHAPPIAWNNFDACHMYSCLFSQYTSIYANCNKVFQNFEILDTKEGPKVLRTRNLTKSDLCKNFMLKTTLLFD